MDDNAGGWGGGWRDLLRGYAGDAYLPAISSLELYGADWRHNNVGGDMTSSARQPGATKPEPERLVQNGYGGKA